MKNKLGVMLLTFLVLIVITPFVFNKLMNAKLNEMIINLNQHGFYIKEIKDESSYLTTKRYFDFKLPGKIINSSIKWLEFEGYITFKNLPVTSVFMRGVLIDSKADFYIQQLLNALKNKLTLNITTPNFKVFKFRADDINDKIILQNFQGIYQKDNLSYTIKKLEFNNNLFTNVNIKNSKTSNLIAFSLKDYKGFIWDNFVLKTSKNNNSLKIKSSLKKAILKNLEVEDAKLDSLIVSSKIKYLEEGNFNEFKKYPLKINSSLDVKNVNNLGELHIKLIADFKNLKNIQKNNYDFINSLEFKLKASEKLIIFVPKELKNHLKQENGYIKLEVVIKNNKVIFK